MHSTQKCHTVNLRKKGFYKIIVKINFMIHMTYWVVIFIMKKFPSNKLQRSGTVRIYIVLVLNFLSSSIATCKNIQQNCSFPFFYFYSTSLSSCSSSCSSYSPSSSSYTSSWLAVEDWTFFQDKSPTTVPMEACMVEFD